LHTYLQGGAVLQQLAARLKQRLPHAAPAGARKRRGAGEASLTEGPQGFDDGVRVAPGGDEIGPRGEERRAGQGQGRQRREGRPGGGVAGVVVAALADQGGGEGEDRGHGVAEGPRQVPEPRGDAVGPL